ncbi:hypothetical protein AVEN_183908-1 [Araneus ventricosus]|uniref:Uncharacterized protein n=1 Tax=Araneus ventricosus TaxID=182803 RepID=A0A4Y2V1J8_ARAVE|nr:hypothetical protein AVEN_183908-1 [Araneus ventricosus]
MQGNPPWADLWQGVHLGCDLWQGNPRLVGLAEITWTVTAGNPPWTNLAAGNPPLDRSRRRSTLDESLAVHLGRIFGRGNPPWTDLWQGELLGTRSLAGGSHGLVTAGNHGSFGRGIHLGRIFAVTLDASPWRENLPWTSLWQENPYLGRGQGESTLDASWRGIHMDRFCGKSQQRTCCGGGMPWTLLWQGSTWTFCGSLLDASVAESPWTSVGRRSTPWTLLWQGNHLGPSVAGGHLGCFCGRVHPDAPAVAGESPWTLLWQGVRAFCGRGIHLGRFTWQEITQALQWQESTLGCFLFGRRFLSGFLRFVIFWGDLHFGFLYLEIFERVFHTTRHFFGRYLC